MPITALPDPHFLSLDPGHRMAWYSVGDAAAPPVLVLHGGPGGRTRAASLNWFDGLGLRCIAHDQRGCGLSTPAGDVTHNRLADLVDDIERLREHLGVDRWGVVGGSWGSLLAVAYAAAHAERVGGLWLRSSFLGSAAEVDFFFAPWSRWLGADGTAWLLNGPSGGQADVAVRTDAAQLTSPVRMLQAGVDPRAADRIALAWQAFEQAQASPGGAVARSDARFAPPPADAVVAPFPPGLRVQLHYLQHGCFVDACERSAWLEKLDAALADRPVALVHGLADAVCDAAVSRALAARWPQAQCRWVPEAGHDMDHPALRAALVEAASNWAERLHRSV